MKDLGADGQGAVDDSDHKIPAVMGGGGAFACADDEADRQEFGNESTRRRGGSS